MCFGLLQTTIFRELTKPPRGSGAFITVINQKIIKFNFTFDYCFMNIVLIFYWIVMSVFL